MKIKPFELERYFAKYEFSAPYLLSASDCEPLTLKELLKLGDEESLGLWENLWLGYTESQGLTLLRKEIAELYQNISKDEVLVLTPEEGIFIMMNVLLEKGDHVITTFPGYQSLYELAESIGCEVTKWSPNKDANWKFDIGDLKKSIKPSTKLIVINFPHNPTGATIGIEDLNEIVKIAKARYITIFSDEMYRLLDYKESDRLPSVSDLYENAISLFGVSKTFALAGLRIGWLTTKNKEIYRKLADFKDYTTICSSAPSEILALMALRARDKIVARNMKIIETNLTILNDFFAEHRSLFKWVKPKAGTIGFPELITGQNVTDFCQNLVDNKGVMLLPAKVYDYEENNFRVGFGRKNMPEALNKLKEYLDESS